MIKLRKRSLNFISSSYNLEVGSNKCKWTTSWEEERSRPFPGHSRFSFSCCINTNVSPETGTTWINWWMMSFGALSPKVIPLWITGSASSSLICLILWVHSYISILRRNPHQRSSLSLSSWPSWGGTLRLHHTPRRRGAVSLCSLVMFQQRCSLAQ